jgi:PmbA protein
MGKTEAEVTSFDYRTGGSWSLDGAETGMRESADGFIRCILSCFGPRKIPSYKGPVLFAPAVLQELILFPLLFHTSGRQIMDGKSRWGDSLGDVVATSTLTIRDDPFDLELSGASPFDKEGVATSPLTIVEKGLLVAHTDDSYTANRRGTVSTGHAGDRQAPSIGPGSSTLDELRSAAPRLITVERFSGNVDPVSGDFSGVAKNSHLWEKGEYAHPITETMIAGNFFDLIQNISGVSSVSSPWENAIRAPWILADGVSVTGQ